MRFEISRAMNGPGGQGIGGVLLGTRLADYFRIVGHRLIPCEHALGPEFRLSAVEESGLPALLEDLKSGTGWQDPQPVGWFVSHPRGDFQLSKEEARLHQKFFGGGQLVMVAKPDRLGEMEVAVHYAQEGADGGARLVAPVLSVVPNGSFRPERKSASDGQQDSVVKVSLPNQAGAGKAASPALVTSGGSKAVMVMAALALLLASLCGVWYWTSQRTGGASTAQTLAQTPIEMLSLNAYENSGRFYISWNGAAEAIQRAERIVLLIQDGDRTTRHILSKREAATGVHIYRRIGSEVNVTLEVHGENGGVEKESTLYTSSDFSPPALLRATPETTPAELFDPAGISYGPQK